MSLRVRIGIPVLIALVIIAALLGRRSPDAPRPYQPAPPAYPAPAPPAASPAPLPPLDAKADASDPIPTPPPDDGLGEYPPWNGRDLDCSGFNGPVRVTRPDRHGLDRDGDGVGCEK